MVALYETQLICGMGEVQKLWIMLIFSVLAFCYNRWLEISQRSSSPSTSKQFHNLMRKGGWLKALIRLPTINTDSTVQTQLKNLHRLESFRNLVICNSLEYLQYALSSAFNMLYPRILSFKLNVFNLHFKYLMFCGFIVKIIFWQIYLICIFLVFPYPPPATSSSLSLQPFWLLSCMSFQMLLELPVLLSSPPSSAAWYHLQIKPSCHQKKGNLGWY